MYDIHRRDNQVFVREVLRFGPLLLVGALSTLNIVFWITPWMLTLSGLLFAWTIYAAYKRSVLKRFYSNKFRLLWEACQDRLKRFHEALGEAKKRGVPELQDLPKTVEQVAETLYVALRRSDVVVREVMSSEGWLVASGHGTGPLSPDQRAQELYQLADRNIAEYRHHYQSVMAGVERTEAQAVVFTTTLDTLRMRMLGHRLVGRSPEVAHIEFLQAMTEAQMQLDSIDKALDELELTPFPGESTATAEQRQRFLDGLANDAELGEGPPPIPEAAKKRINDGGRGQ